MGNAAVAAAVVRSVRASGPNVRRNSIKSLSAFVISLSLSLSPPPLGAFHPLVAPRQRMVQRGTSGWPGGGGASLIVFDIINVRATGT